MCSCSRPCLLALSRRRGISPTLYHNDSHQHSYSYRFIHFSSFTGRVVTSLNYEKSPALPFLPYPENLRGYVGDVGFDPFRFSDFVPMDFLREAEIKHGRICMLAWAGFVSVDLGFKIYPFPEAYEGLTSATAHDALVKQGAMGQILLWASIAEIISTIAVSQMMSGSGRQPGDFGLDPIGFLTGKSEADVNEMKLKELTNGRLAMLAFSGVVTQAVLTQGPFPYV